MAFFRRIFGRSQPKAPIRTDVPMAFYLNGEGKMQAVKADGYIQHSHYSRVGLGYIIQHAEQYARAAIASVWAANCINLRADTLSRLDWFVRNKVTKERIETHPFEIALENSQQNVIRLMEKRLLTYGEVFIKPLRNDANFNSGFFVLNNLDVEVDTSQGYVSGFMYNPQGVRHMNYYSPQEIIYLHTDNDFDDNRGLSKFEHVMLEIQIDRDISRTTAAFYRNDARPGLLLIPDTQLDTERAEEFTEYWNAQFKGPDKSGRAVLLPTTIKEVKEFQRAPALDDVELRESTRRETCAAFKVPLSMAGAWDDATYQSLPEQRKAFYEETIIPAAESHARDLTKHALPFFDISRENEVYFDASKIMSLVENEVEKVDLATRKLQSGAYTINEVRESLDDDPIQGGNIHLMQSGWIPVRSEELATFEAPNTASPDMQPQLPEPQQSPETMTIEPTRHEHSHGDLIHYEPVDTVAVKTIHEEALKELRSWMKFVSNGKAQKRDFSNYMIRDDIADAIKAALETGDDETIKTAFKDAETQIAIKTVNAVRSNFELEIKQLIDGAVQNTLPRVRFTNRLKASLRSFGMEAYRAGLTDGGVITNQGEEFETEDAAIFEGMLAEQLQYAKNLAEQVYRKGLSDAQIRLKPRQWWAKSMQPFYDAGLLSANRNGMVEIVGEIDDNSCDTCKALVGQRHRRRSFMAAGLMPPYGSSIICGDGGSCKHRAISVNSGYRGHLSRVPRK